MDHVGRGRRRFLAGAAALGAAGWLQVGRVSVADVGCAAPAGFPDGIELFRSQFRNWAQEIVVDDVWTCRPADAAQVAVLANWAAGVGVRLRPRGAMHGWAPLCVAVDDGCDPGVVMVDTSALGGIAFGERNGVATVRAGAGVLLDDLHEACKAAGVGVLNAPALGNVTVGGVLAIGGHGTSVPAAGEERPIAATFGSLSNLVTELEVVAFDPAAGRYVVQTIDRTDGRIGSLLVHLGRTFVTAATLQVADNVRLRCQSDVVTPVAELFAPPGSVGRTIERILDEAGRAEVIWYAFAEQTWLKTWTPAPEQPPTARAVDGPYNYPFSDNIPVEISDLATEIVQGNGQATRLFGPLVQAVTVAGLAATASLDLWGWSQDLLRYIKPTTLRVTQVGHLLLVARRDVQRAVHELADHYQSMLAEYADRGEFPVSLGIEIRFSGLDRASDVDAVPGARAATLSPLRPSEAHPDRDVGIWINILSFPETPGRERFSREFERWLYEHYAGYADVHVEWAKSWAFADDATWVDPEVLGDRIPDAFRARRTGRARWEGVVAQLDALDPASVWRTDLHDRLMPRHT